MLGDHRRRYWSKDNISKFICQLRLFQLYVVKTPLSATMSAMKQQLAQSVADVLISLGIADAAPRLDYPENPEHGDFSSNVALAYAKKLGMSPKALAEKIADALAKNMPDFLKSVEIAGPGFINFKVKDEMFASEVLQVNASGADFGKSAAEKGRNVMVEYTDPNPFKIFHIGHLMANAIGESISRLVQFSGAEVIRACYQGDVGLHVAKTIWAILKKHPDGGIPHASEQGADAVVSRVKFLGEMYVEGSTYDEDAEIQKEIAVINKSIFEKSDPLVNAVYAQGRKWSLDYFDLIYKRLGTSFDVFFFESEVAKNGTDIVKEFLKKGIFAESDGAVVFKGEDHGLHTRVFLTSQGLPTYEAKELGLNTEKFKRYPKLDESVIITGNEQSDYFKVILKVFELINKAVFDKTRHISHGILRFASGKMSSRKGNIVSAETLIDDIKKLVMDKISDRGFSDQEAAEISDIIAVGAIKYTILRQSIGGDVIFDSAASISFEGDSGPYLQYAAVRAASILDKADKEGIDAAANKMPDQVGLLEKLISRFPDTVERARQEYAPQHVANYLITLAGAFNGFYANQMIVDAADPLSPYRVALTKAFLTVMVNGLHVLGIKVPAKM